MKRKIFKIAAIYMVSVAPTTFADAGDFTPSQHLNFLVKAEEAWADGKHKDDEIANVAAATQLLSQQTARFKMLDDPDKDNKVKIAWISTCGLEDQDCTTDCALDFPELETKMKEYEMGLCREAGFAINREKARTNIMTIPEQVAAGFLKIGNELDEWWAKQVLLHYKTFASTNVAPAPWTYAAGTTTIPAASYKLSMLATLMKQMQLNRVKNAFFIENGTLFEEYTNAILDAGNAEGKGLANRANYFKDKLEFDMWNFVSAGLTEDLFMVDKNAVAMKSYNRHKGMEVIGGKVGQTRYKIKSPNLPGVEYDVFYEVTCKVIEGKSVIMDTWKAKTYGDIFLNPEPCPIEVGEDTLTPSGVWSFTKGA